MKELRYYLKYDIKQLIKKNTTKYFLAILFTIIILDTINTYFTQLKYYNISEISANWYVLLENSGSVVRGFYLLFFPVLVSLPFGLQYFNEKDCRYRQYLIERGSRKSYYLSKFFMSFVVGFITIFFPLIINYIIVLNIYPNTFTLGGTFLEPDSGAFLEKIFYMNINLYHFIYIIVNSLIGGIISLLSLSLCMVFNYKSGFLVIAIPFIIMTTQSIILYFFNVHYDILHIIQPVTRFALVKPITGYHVLVSTLLWCSISIILFYIGYRKERDIL